MLALAILAFAFLETGASPVPRRLEEAGPIDPGEDPSQAESEKDDKDGVCHYLEFDAGIKMDNPNCNGKCSVAGTAKNEYDCVTADNGECCAWDDNKLLKECTLDSVQNELYKAADVCCDETTETCDGDGWPETCNLGCAAVMVPLVQKCLESFPSLGLATAVTPLRTATHKCPCSAEINTCYLDTVCDAALDVLPDLTIPEYKEYFTADDGRPDHFNAGKSPTAAKSALLKCYQQQHYSDGADAAGNH